MKSKSQNGLNKLTQEVIDFDAIDAAESLLGKDSEAANSLGLALFLEKNKLKTALLEKLEDTHFNISFNAFIGIASEMGFQEVFSETFLNNSSEVPVDEEFKLFWDETRGILLQIESWGKTKVNSANIYYNWTPTGKNRYSKGLGSFHVTKDSPDEAPIFVASKDVRDGLGLTIQTLCADGDFLPVWKEQPFLWLVNFSHRKESSDFYHEKTAEIIKQLPPKVQLSISVPNIFKK